MFWMWFVGSHGYGMIWIGCVGRLKRLCIMHFHISNSCNRLNQLKPARFQFLVERIQFLLHDLKSKSKWIHNGSIQMGGWTCMNTSFDDDDDDDDDDDALAWKQGYQVCPKQSRWSFSACVSHMFAMLKQTQMIQVEFQLYPYLDTPWPMMSSLDTTCCACWIHHYSRYLYCGCETFHVHLFPVYAWYIPILGVFGIYLSMHNHLFWLSSRRKASTCGNMWSVWRLVGLVTWNAFWHGASQPFL